VSKVHEILIKNRAIYVKFYTQPPQKNTVVTPRLQKKNPCKHVTLTGIEVHEISIKLIPIGTKTKRQMIPIGTKTEPKFQPISIKKFPEREECKEKRANVGKSYRSGNC